MFPRSKRLLLLFAFPLILPVVSRAGVPDPATSSYGVSPTPVGCQYRFRADGGLDELTVEVTVRHTFGYVMPGILTSATLNPAPDTPAFCSCCDVRQSGSTDSSGVFVATFSRIGGHGSLTIDVTAHSYGPIPFFSIPVDFTSPDLDASCDPPPNSTVTILDIGLWSAGGPETDYDCNGVLNILDIGLFSGGLGVPCDPAGCP